MCSLTTFETDVKNEYTLTSQRQMLLHAECFSNLAYVCAYVLIMQQEILRRNIYIILSKYLIEIHWYSTLTSPFSLMMQEWASYEPDILDQ